MSTQILLDSVHSAKMDISRDIPKTKSTVIRIKKSKKKVEPVDISETIPDIIPPIQDEIEKEVLSHLGSYTEEPFNIIESYFHEQPLERLVRHQIESYNHFINYQIYRTIQMFNTVKIHSDNDYIVDKDLYLLEIEISFSNFKLYPPQIHENNGATKIMLPDEAKLRNFTYASTMAVDLNIKYTIRNSESMDNPKVIMKTLPKINIGKMPIMLKSSICILKQNNHIHP